MSILIKKLQIRSLCSFRNYCLQTQNVNVEEPAIQKHSPVMLKDVIKHLDPKNDNLIIDMTFGAGGHSKSILENSESCKIIALDRDPEAYKKAVELSSQYPGRVVPLLGKISDLPTLLRDNKIHQNTVDSILIDLGCSPMQLNNPKRGFSITENGLLDMRMDGNHDPKQPTAYDILAKASEEQLSRIFKVYGEDKQAKKIARAVVDARYMFRKLETTYELYDLVDSVQDDEIKSVESDIKKPGNKAGKIFQALRIFVNNELNEINYGMDVANKYLKIGGRLVTLTFNSLEDTIVKRHLSGNMVDGMANQLPLKFTDCTKLHPIDSINHLLSSDWQVLTKTVVVASFEEIEDNPRSKSAKLRAAIKVR